MIKTLGFAVAKMDGMDTCVSMVSQKLNYNIESVCNLSKSALQKRSIDIFLQSSKGWRVSPVSYWWFKAASREQILNKGLV